MLPAHPSRPQSGYVVSLVLNVILLLLVAGELVFLASRYRVRIDLTGDQNYTLTDSTSLVLQKLEDRLLVEAYFSPDDELPAAFREYRQTLRNMLDEFAQTSKGKLRVQYFDPQSDADLREKATRLGIKPQRTQDVQQTTLSNKEIWQGLRLMYGGKKQKTVPFIQFSPLAALYEATLTPIIKTLTVADKTKIGVIAQPSLPPVLRGYVHDSQREGPKQFKRILEWEMVTDRYEIVQVDISNRQLIPENLSTLLLIRPKELNDRQKYAIDQFLMRGGKLVVLADSWDVSLGQQRLLRVREIDYDHGDSSLKFLDQLAHYGAKVSEKLLLDDSTATQDPLSILVPTPQGITYAPLPYYPYCFKPLDVDWSTHAAEAAKNAQGEVDDVLAAEYRKTFEPGVDKERAKGLGIPSFFWPCAVELTDPLPEGVQGHVLMRTSPWAIEQAPPADVNPVGAGENMQVSYNQFGTAIKQLVNSEPRRQLGLMVELSGAFPSYFDGRKIPPAREEEQPKVIKLDAGDPLEEPISTDPVKDASQDGDAKDQEPEVLGPKPEAGTESAAAGDPEPILRAREGAKLVVLGDAEFIRDDLITGEYQSVGGPISATGPLFFINLLDWLAEDQDLFALRRKQTTDRRQQFLSDEEVRGAANLQKLEERKRRKESVVRLANIAVPPAILLLFGIIVFVQRRAKKRAFLARIGS